jgi:predicted phage terminase large subunit-like protein
MATGTATEAAWVGDPPIRITRYIRQSPELPQHAFLFIDGVLEALYGGAAGGGKSSALLAAALQYVDVPGYSALLLRRTFPDLNQPDALIPRSKEWLAGSGATWNDNDHRWTFPSGATLTFGHMQHEDNKLQYQGAAFQFVGFDELTQFSETQYTYLFSRCRRPKLPDNASDEDRRRIERLSQVPLRVRAASNPGGSGHDWVKARFGIYREDGDPRSAQLVCHRESWPHGRVFIPAKLSDNPHLDQGSYRSSLDELDHHTRSQLLDGDWDSRPPGDLFRRSWFEILDAAPEGCRWVRFWDLAATEPSDANPDPDWTVGARVGRHPNGSYIVEDIERLRRRPDAVKQAIRHCAQRDGKSTVIWIAQDPAQAGKSQIDDFIRDPLLAPYAVKGRRETGSKFVRAQPVSAKAEHGLVKLKRATWNAAFLDEHEAFTQTDEHSHDDQVDALSGAFGVLATAGGASTQSRLPDGLPLSVVRGNLVLVGEQYIDRT